LRLLLATHNEHKRRELARLLPEPAPGEEAWQLDVLTGRASIADDSGIAAAALGGAPGVRSARYAGEHASDGENLAKLLRDAPAGSGLEYVCAIAYVDPATGEERLFHGRCAGRLAAEPRGEGGFGYDPAFLADEGPEGQTMAELSDEQKDAISHRGRAARALFEWLGDRAAAA